MPPKRQGCGSGLGRRRHHAPEDGLANAVDRVHALLAHYMEKCLDREVPWHACDQPGCAMLPYRSDQTSSLLEAATRLYQKPESLIVRFWLRKSV